MVWDNTAFGLAAAPGANNAWKEFKDFIGDASAGLGGTIYKDCSDGYFKHYTAAFTAADADGDGFLRWDLTADPAQADCDDQKHQDREVFPQHLFHEWLLSERADSRAPSIGVLTCACVYSPPPLSSTKPMVKKVAFCTSRDPAASLSAIWASRS